MSFLGIGAGAEREQERKTRQAQDKANRKAAKNAERERQARVKYDQEGLEIRKRNDEQMRAFQMDKLNDAYEHDLAIRSYQMAQEDRIYEARLTQYTDQKNFNELAFDQAIRQQDRYLGEQLVGMEFDKAQTLLNYNGAVAGLILKKSAAKETADIQLGKLRDTSYLAMDKARSQTAFSKRQTNIDMIKAAGQAAARGQAGVSAGKVQQGIKAEAGAAKAQMSKQLLQQQRETMVTMYHDQRSIVNQLLTSNAEVNLELTKLNDKLDLDQAKMAINRQNLLANDKLTREQIALQRKQNDLKNVKPIQPLELPPIPPPRDIPIPEYQDVYEGRSIDLPDPLPKGPAAYTNWGGIAQDVLGLTVGALTGGLGAGAGGTFHWGKAALGAFGIETGKNTGTIGGSIAGGLTGSGTGDDSGRFVNTVLEWNKYTGRET